MQTTFSCTLTLTQVGTHCEGSLNVPIIFAHAELYLSARSCSQIFYLFCLVEWLLSLLLPVIPENASSQHYLIIVIFISGLFLLHC